MKPVIVIKPIALSFAWVLLSAGLLGCSADPIDGAETGRGSQGSGGAHAGTGGAQAGAAGGISGGTGGTGGAGAGTGGTMTGSGGIGSGGVAAGSGGMRSGSGGAGGAGGSTGGAGGGPMGTGGGAPGGLRVLTDTNRDGTVDDQDTPGLTDWAWKGAGAFFIANVDDDDKKGKADASDQIVNGAADEADLARIIIKVPADAMARTASIAVTVAAGAADTHLFEKAGATWKLLSGAVSQVAAQVEIGIEATRFADTDWDGFAAVKVELMDAAKASVASQQVKLRVAPWIMLPQSAKTELLYMSSTTARLRPDLNKVLQSVGLPDAVASNPAGQDVWFQDTMEIGYTQLPHKPPMHVVMRAQRPNASDNVAVGLLAPNFGFISVGMPRQPPNQEDHWMDWMGNLEVTHPVPAYPLGRIYYGKSERTTFHPTIVKFLEAQQVQKPFAVNTNWLIIQHVDEVMNFLADKNGKAKMIIVSPAAANAVMGSGYDAGNQQIQKYIDEDIALAKAELGLSDADIIQLPTLFQGSGTDYAPRWSNPVNSVLAGSTFMVGKTNTPAQIKADIETKLGAIGVQVAWVDDAEYEAGGGNVHCGTNTKKTPICASFTDCL